MSNTVKVLHHFLAGDQICPQQPGNDQLPAVSCHAMSHKICAGCPAAAAHLTDAATNSALVLRSDWMTYSSNNTGHHSVKIAQVKSRPKHTSLSCERLLASRITYPATCRCSSGSQWCQGTAALLLRSGQGAKGGIQFATSTAIRLCGWQV
jgi:hypothetical protein